MSIENVCTKREDFGKVLDVWMVAESFRKVIEGIWRVGEKRQESYERCLEGYWTVWQVEEALWRNMDGIARVMELVFVIGIFRKVIEGVGRVIKSGRLPKWHTALERTSGG